MSISTVTEQRDQKNGRARGGCRDDAAQPSRRNQALKISGWSAKNHAGYVETRNAPPGKFGEYVRQTVDDENADRAR